MTARGYYWCAMVNFPAESCFMTMTFMACTTMNAANPFVGGANFNDDFCINYNSGLVPIKREASSSAMTVK